MRYWTDARTERDADDVVGWYAVVDEERGGIVAYFGSEDDAAEYIAIKNAEKWAAQ